MSEVVRIGRMGKDGDGIADTGAGPVYVPFSLPGETVAIARHGNKGTLLSVREASVDRVSPVCRHFEDCGGCALQHWTDAGYRNWKRSLVADALRQNGLEAPLAELVPAVPHARRRATFSTAIENGKPVVGFSAAASHRIVPVSECHVLQPALFLSAGDVATIVRILGAKSSRITVTVTNSGLDFSVSWSGKLTPRMRQELVRHATDRDLARLTVGGEMIVEPRPPTVEFAGIPVPFPAGGFLQATKAAEEAMVELVAAHLSGMKRVADLFSGCGTFTFPLARKSAVHAVETEASAMAAVDRARRNASGLKPVSVEQRDLFRRPLLTREFDAFDGVVFDPPRAGAEAQSRQLAKSKVRRIAAVSCNPVTLARDLRILVDGGYTIAGVTPIDQFLWTPHVEAVALLVRK